MGTVVKKGQWRMWKMDILNTYCRGGGGVNKGSRRRENEGSMATAALGARSGDTAGSHQNPQPRPGWQLIRTWRNPY